MAVIMYFLATSASQKRLDIQEIERLSLRLLDSQFVSLPVAVYGGEARNIPVEEDDDDDVGTVNYLWKTIFFRMLLK